MLKHKVIFLWKVTPKGSCLVLFQNLWPPMVCTVQKVHMYQVCVFYKVVESVDVLCPRTECLNEVQSCSISSLYVFVIKFIRQKCQRFPSYVFYVCVLWFLLLHGYPASTVYENKPRSSDFLLRNPIWQSSFFCMHDLSITCITSLDHPSTVCCHIPSITSDRILV